MSQYTEQDRELLEAQANQLGVDFHPNISSEKLAARIAEVMEGQEPQEKERPVKGETKEYVVIPRNISISRLYLTFASNACSSSKE